VLAPETQSDAVTALDGLDASRAVVANLTRRDGEEFLAVASRVPVRTEVETFSLEQANDALSKLRAGGVLGSLVLVP
jgi:D-arabinose 1-dehydrogenase-like Zn-dependent alcohol dehydrogenase